MKRLKIIIILFSIALSIPLAALILRTYQGLEREEVSKLRFFAEALFDEMEDELADLVYEEESRAVDEYNRYYTPQGGQQAGQRVLSPLSDGPRKAYILGYFQNNPDGTMQTPQAGGENSSSLDEMDHYSRLKTANQIFNRKKFSVSEQVRSRIPKGTPQKTESKETVFGEQYLSRTKSAAPKQYLGRKKQRMEEISVNQAINVAPKLQARYTPSDESPPAAARALEEKASPKKSDQWDHTGLSVSGSSEMEIDQTSPFLISEKFRVEVAPFQSVFIDSESVFFFRRIMIDNRIYRQGFLIAITDFFNHLVDTHFRHQPISRFTRLDLSVGRGNGPSVVAGAHIEVERFRQLRTFPAPFDFLNAALICEDIPVSSTRGILNAVMMVLVAVILMGLFAIYRSARVVVELSERRQQFVSSVTHELKTPLTNIRMYIEMLEQGIAPTKEREQDYFEVLGSESARLSRLINNVLELSRLEKKQRTFEMVRGTFKEVIEEVTILMGANLTQEGFHFTVENSAKRPFEYDREVMIQILLNLIENSIKFGRHNPEKRLILSVTQDAEETRICLSDTGPGIPRKALKKIFDDFYRVDNELARTTGGTGIGLALVKKFTHAMGARVTAANNQGAGCTITITMHG
jgi:signal transduction histidine kinase